MAKNILEVKNLSKYFISKHGVNKAVDNVSFNLEEGEIIGLVGQSGSGKSTIGNALMRTLPEVNGMMILDGKVISGKINKKTRKEYREKVQMIFQDPHTSLNEKRNVFSTIAEPLKTNKIINKETKEFLEGNSDVKKVFNLSFKSKQIENELKHLNVKKDSFDKALAEIKTNLDNYESMKFKDFDNQLSELTYSYFQPISEAYRLVFNNLVASNEDLYNIYVKASSDVKNKNLPDDEVALINSIEEISKLENEIKTFNSQAKFISKAEKKATKSINKKIKETRNLINGFIGDYKRKAKFHKSVADVQSKKATFDIQMAKVVEAKEVIGKLKLLRNAKAIISTNDMLTIVESIETSDIHAVIGQATNKTAKTIDSVNKTNGEIIEEMKKIFDKFDLEKAEAKLEKAKVKLEKDQELFDKELAIFEVEWESKFNKTTADLAEVAVEVSQKNIEVEFAGVTAKFEELVDELITSMKLKLEEKKTKVKIEKTKKSKVDFKEYSLLIKNASKLIKDERTKLNDFVAQEKLLIKTVEKSKVFLGTRKPTISLYFDTKKILLNRRVFKSLSDVGLKAEHAYRYPHEFSGGQKQRIVIARALIMNPKVIVADEPIASLDVSIQAQVVNILIKLARRDNISMIFIGHDLSVIEYLADSMLVMHLGKIVEKGTTGPIFGNPVHPYTNLLFDAIPKLSTANKPFETTNLSEDYLAGYANETPKFVKVNGNKNHLVLMNEDQSTRWTKEATKKTPVKKAVVKKVTKKDKIAKKTK